MVWATTNLKKYKPHFIPINCESFIGLPYNGEFRLVFCNFFKIMISIDIHDDAIKKLWLNLKSS